MLQAFRAAQFFGIGFASFGLRGFKEHAKSFDSKALDVDLKGRHIIVTGGTSGIGQAAIQALASHNATVHLICRDANRGEAVRESIMSESIGSDVRVHVCDISSLADVARLAEEFVHSNDGVHALINNAGVMQHEVVESKDGFESSFAINTLGIFALTEMLRPALQRVPDARVVTVSSGGMLTERLEIEDLEGKNLRKDETSIDGTTQYARCKRMQVALTEHWARKYPNSFWAASMHPGWVDTPGVRSSMPHFYNVMKKQLRSPEQGADTVVYLAVADKVTSLKSGQFFFDREPTPKHLWQARTEYKESDVECLVHRLSTMVEEKGFMLPE